MASPWERHRAAQAQAQGVAIQSAEIDAQMMPGQQPAATLAPPSVSSALASTAQAVAANTMGFGVLAGTNALGSSLSGNTDASQLAFVLNLVAQPIKWPKWVDEHWMLPLLLFVVGAVLVYSLRDHDGWKVLTTTAQAVVQSLTNYRALGATAMGGILPSTPVPNSH